MAEKAPPQAGWVTAEQMGRIVMLTDERLRQIANMGYFPKAVKGQYQVIPTVQGYIKFLKDEDRRGQKNAAENGLKQARQREIEMRIAQNDSLLIDIDEHDAVVDDLVGMFLTGLTGLPARITRDPILRRKIESECDQLRGSLAARAAKMASELSEGRTVTEAAAAHDA